MCSSAQNGSCDRDFATETRTILLQYRGMQEIDELHERLERSQQVILELEENSRRSGQRDSDIAEMIRKTREATEIELKRYMEETEAKHNLDVSLCYSEGDGSVCQYIFSVYIHGLSFS